MFTIDLFHTLSWHGLFASSYLIITFFIVHQVATKCVSPKWTPPPPYGPLLWTIPLMDPHMDPSYGPPLWTPLIWTPLMDPHMDPPYGPLLWTPLMDPSYGPPLWTPLMDPPYGPPYGPILWTPSVSFFSFILVSTHVLFSFS